MRLGEIDDAARELQSELKSLPAGIEEMKSDLERLEGMLGQERVELDEAKTLQVSHEDEVKNANELLTRAKAKGAKAKNAREVEAAEREMQNARQTIRDREQDQLKLMEAIEQKAESLTERERKLEEFRKIYEEESTAAKTRMTELETKIGEITKGRDEEAAKIDRTLVSRYNRIRAKHGTAIAEVRTHGTCQGCRLRIPPQQYNTMQRGESIEQCPHCLRFLYLAKDGDAEDAAEE
ncbi:MAG: C4-type zinc ribbon domain-containing protein [Myxococcota bacterium]